MALIKCSECGREISDKSKACIHCGNPIVVKNENVVVQKVNDVDNKKKDIIEEVEIAQPKKNNKSNFNNLIGIILLISLVVVGILYFNNRNAELKTQATNLHEIYLDINQAYVYCDEAFINAATVLGEDRYWETDLESAFLSVYSKGKWDKSNIVDARVLLEKVDIALETNVKASQLLPKQFSELEKMRDYMRDYFDYIGMYNPDTDVRFDTGPDWMDYFDEMVSTLNDYSDIEESFLIEINKLR